MPADGAERREVPFRVRLRNPATGHYSNTYDLEGHADGVVAVGGQVDQISNLGLIENKLVGQITPLKVRHLPLDQQVALMRYGLWRATGRPVTQVSYRWVKKPGIRQKQGESIDQYLERLAADYHERPDFYSHAEDYFATTDDLLRIESEPGDRDGHPRSGSREHLRAQHEPLHGLRRLPLYADLFRGS